MADDEQQPNEVPEHGFWVWAPNADDVRLQLFHPDGNDAEPYEGIPMNREDSGVWSVTVRVPYGMQYMFRVVRGEEEVWRIDPRAVEVTHSMGRSIVHDPAFDWTDGEFQAAPVNAWVIYELHPGTFGATLDGVIERLDHLVDLGVNAIELMPVSEFAGSQSWGYNPAVPFAVESSYGGPAAMRRLVDAAHSRGLAVIADVVYNHLGPSDLDLWRFDGWYEGDGGGIYFYNDEWKSSTPWGNTRPDYGREEVRRYLIDNARMWVAGYHVDGLRLDSTISIRNAFSRSGPDGDLAEGWDFLRELTGTIHAEFPGVVLIAEDHYGGPIITAPIDHGGLGFDLQWSAEFVHPVRDALETMADDDRDLGAVAAAVVGAEGDIRRVIYTESHDEVANGKRRVTTEVDEFNPDSIFAHRRAAIGAVLTMTSPGTPMLFQGQEWSDEDWFDDSRGLNWERAAERRGVVQMWTDLIRLRTGADDRAPGLRGANTECEQIGPHGRVLAIRRWGDEGRERATVIVVNLKNRDHDELYVPFPSERPWRCVFASDWSGYHPSGSDTLPQAVAGPIPFPAYGAAIFAPE